MRILIIEDHPAIAANLYDYLEAQGHQVEAAQDGRQGHDLATRQRFDVIVLDLGLPGMDGMELMRRLRQDARVETPVLMLTARDTLRDKIDGFDAGADDYLVKPFALEEVAARVAALHRRSAGKVVSRPLQVGDLRYDPDHSTVHFAGGEVRLPPKCLRLFELFIKRPGHLFRREELEIELWGDAQETSDRLRTQIHLLRQALTRAGGRDPIATVHGLGFRLDVDQ